jgi:uncharacterized membrane protein
MSEGSTSGAGRIASAANEPTAPAVKPVHVRIGFGARLRAYFFAGILITAPISITFYLAWLFIDFVDSKVTPLIPDRFNPETYLPFAVPGLGLAVVLGGLTLIGALTAGFIGRLLTRIYESVLEHLPIVRSIYKAVKQVTETVLVQQTSTFGQAVLVRFPHSGSWAIGFVTGMASGEVQVAGDDEILNVFLPTTPNPTSGFLLLVPRRDVIVLKMPAEDALKLVISGGIVVPSTTAADAAAQGIRAVADERPP